MIVSNSTKTTKKWKEYVSKKYNNVCAKCGSQYGLVAHHIKSRKERPDLINETENGILLCRKCHIEEHQKNGDIKIRHIEIDYLIENLNNILNTDYTQEELLNIKQKIVQYRLKQKFGDFV